LASSGEAHGEGDSDSGVRLAIHGTGTFPKLAVEQ
jgi:hypothetical protein